MAESLPADKDNGSDVPLLDEEEQASEFTMAKYLFSTRKKVFARPICLLCNRTPAPSVHCW